MRNRRLMSSASICGATASGRLLPQRHHALDFVSLDEPGVVINGGLHSLMDAPFGGDKRSGLGREFGANRLDE
jgi:hypothetical protein